MSMIQMIAAITDLDLSGLPHQGNATHADLQTILSIIIGVLGAVAVLFIVVGGLRYILSGGDAAAVSKAKGTIVYALIGLIVAISAEAIVAFVLGGL